MLQDAINAIPLPALVIDASEQVVLANAHARAALPGLTEGRNVALVLRAPSFLQAVGEALKGRVPLDEPRFSLIRDGAEQQWQASVGPVAAPEGQMALCVFRDLSDEVLASQMRRDFVANVSHELRTPLTALMGFIETLRGAAKEDPVARERFLAIMARESGRMERLVQDLLQLSRVEAEERVRPSTPVDLAAVLRQVTGALKPMAESLGAEMELEGFDRPLTVPGDSDQLVQVFTNLVENGLKYGAAGQVLRLRATAENSIRGPALRITVSDQGEGIDPIHIPRLTERFYRIDGHRSREKGGTGLGLAIVKHIVQRHRGWLKLESVKGVGSSFSVILPQG
ncbi:ATP-binding protein [Xinfangfangia sp. CPCC 101601]|uniref:histidine kinase n=1 Tax=Pseudogemmobacter lacusdianii TaxID=3069608 RepID=A0ABU0VV47_9RHOB|nr:ATP-binding protein [Xinfangfangia sp. CPCC 101601]MDQ2065621.1 ATP-binding protein [Xinfangfangia sp. CPCC 101601]